MGNPIISIVFTSYNHKEFLQQAIESLLCQTFRDFEIIIVDDCSSDGSQEVLLKYKNHEKVRLYLLAKNSGSYVKSTNYGANLAKGKYLLFAQCDDFAEPMQLEQLYTAIYNNSQIGVAFCRSNMIDINGCNLGTDYEVHELKFRNQCSSNVMINKKQMTKYLCNACVIPNLSAALFHKKLYEQVGGLSTNYLVVADWLFWLEISQLSDFYYVSTPLNNFRQHATTIRSLMKINKQVIEIYDMFYGFISRYSLSSKDLFRLKVRMAIIWIEYFPQSPKTWALSFFPLQKRIHKFDKFSLFFFVLAAISTSFFFCTKKITKLLRYR